MEKGNKTWKGKNIWKIISDNFSELKKVIKPLTERVYKVPNRTGSHTHTHTHTQTYTDKHCSVKLKNVRYK